jgi:multimeric flavodoxin WrbA
VGCGESKPYSIWSAVAPIDDQGTPDPKGEHVSGTKAIGLIGSPRVAGNTAALVEEVLLGAKDYGAEIESVFLNDLDISPCQACNACLPTGRCVLRDDMDDLWEQLWSADIWVFGTPIYWVGPSAQMKTFLDRWYAPSSHVQTRDRFSGRRARRRDAQQQHRSR